MRATQTADSENRALRRFGESLEGFQYYALFRQLVVKAVLKLLDEDVLQHNRVCCVWIGAMPDQLDVASERLDAFSRFLTPEIEPLSQMLPRFSNSKVVLHLRLRLIIIGCRLETEVLSHLETFNIE